MMSGFLEPVTGGTRGHLGFGVAATKFFSGWRLTGEFFVSENSNTYESGGGLGVAAGKEIVIGKNLSASPGIAVGYYGAKTWDVGAPINIQFGRSIEEYLWHYHYIVADLPLRLGRNLFIEIGPRLGVAPDFALGFLGRIGARF